jgi:hypothetical protein
MDDPVSPSTVRRTLQKAGLRSCIAAKKAFVNLQQQKRRLAWAKSHADKDSRFSASIVWSDESSFELNKQGRVQVWREVGEQFRQEYLAPTFKSGRISVMVWGRFVNGKKGPLDIFDDAVKNSAACIKILKEFLFPLIASYSFWKKSIIGNITTQFKRSIYFVYRVKLHKRRAMLQNCDTKQRQLQKR